MVLNEIGQKIDIASDKGNIVEINSCILELKSLLNKAINSKETFTIAYYLSNANYCLYQIIESRNGLKQIPNSKYLQESKKYYRIAKEKIKRLDPLFKKQLLVNYANCLDYLGRSVEALYIYDEALEIDSTFSMAIGNKAITSNYFSSITGEYRDVIRIETFQTLKKIINDPNLVNIGGLNAKKHFIKIIKNIDFSTKNKELLNKTIEHKPYSKIGLSNFEKYYLDFCIKNDLFLNFHIQDKNCEAAVCDPIFIKIITKTHDKTSFYNLSRYINQIKEDYAVARVLLVKSQFKQDDISNISRRTLYANPLDYSQSHLYNGFLKSAFKESYDVLDKIAVFLKHYFNLKVDDEKIYFDSNPKNDSSFWVRKIKDYNEEVIIKDEILNTNNISLFALFDIYKDFRNGYYKGIKDIRNALTHRQLTIYENIIK